MIILGESISGPDLLQGGKAKNDRCRVSLHLCLILRRAPAMDPTFERALAFVHRGLRIRDNAS